MNYVGRFAPSPTGPLHFGSLLTALASYLDAKAHGGRWLLRIEDVDPPREVAGAAGTIMQQLQALSLHWDGEVLFQSTRSQAYQTALEQLAARGLCYCCDCSRAQIRAMGGVYNGHCRGRQDYRQGSTAIRVRTDARDIVFTDTVYGRQHQSVESRTGDFIVRRKDGWFAYQLAVVVDDAHQHITHVVRGADLLDSTPRQIHLQQLLCQATPRYAHVPLLVDPGGHKLSKQHFAEPIDSRQGSALLFSALTLLNQQPPASIRQLDTAAQLHWAIRHWDMQAVPKSATITIPLKCRN